MTANLFALVPLGPRARILLIILQKEQQSAWKKRESGKIHLPVWCGFAWRWRGTDVAPLKTSLGDGEGGAQAGRRGTEPAAGRSAVRAGTPAGLMGSLAQS